MESVANVTTTNYVYNANGNATTDGQNGKTITYNYLNLPQTVSGGLNYTYDATGQKLNKTAVGQTRHYIGGIEYNGTTIETIQTEEGIARNNAGTYSYEYNLTDHLGNVRLSFHQHPTTQNLDILQRDDYYAFGKRKSGVLPTGAISVNNKYLYNGKELQEELGQYDYGARFYDSVIGRWNVIDEKAELYFQITPYAYAANTPVNAIDPDGKLVIFINGNHYGDGGSRDYWKSGNKDFAGAVMRQVNDHHAMYVDGAGNKMKGYHPLSTLLSPGLSGAGALDRRSAGYDEGKANAAAIIESLHRTGGVIDESIKVITHSMGGAYGKGYIKAILDYAKENNIAGVNFAFEADFAPFQSGDQKAVKGVKTFQFANDNDDVANNKLLGSPFKKIEGAEVTTDSSKDKGHSIFDFMDNVKNLPNGKYKVVNGKIVQDE